MNSMRLQPSMPAFHDHQLADPGDVPRLLDR